MARERALWLEGGPPGLCLRPRRRWKCAIVIFTDPVCFSGIEFLAQPWPAFPWAQCVKTQVLTLTQQTLYLLSHLPSPYLYFFCFVFCFCKRYFYYLLYVYGYSACLGVRAPMLCSAHRSKKRASDSLELLPQAGLELITVLLSQLSSPVIANIRLHT